MIPLSLSRDCDEGSLRRTRGLQEGMGSVAMDACVRRASLPSEVMEITKDSRPLDAVRSSAGGVRLGLWWPRHPAGRHGSCLRERAAMKASAAAWGVCRLWRARLKEKPRVRFSARPLLGDGIRGVCSVYVRALNT